MLASIGVRPHYRELIKCIGTGPPVITIYDLVCTYVVASSDLLKMAVPRDYIIPEPKILENVSCYVLAKLTIL